MRMYLNGELQYGKSIWVIFRMEGDGIIGDGQGVFDPGDKFHGLTYDQIFNELRENGSFEVPHEQEALAA